MRARRNASPKEKLAEEIGVNRRAIRFIEQGKGAVDLAVLDKALTACGETLMLRLSSRPGRKTCDTAIEDEILHAFAAGTPELAEEKLKKIRTWDYPLNQSLARFTRESEQFIALYQRIAKEGEAQIQASDRS